MKELLETLDKKELITLIEESEFVGRALDERIEFAQRKFESIDQVLLELLQIVSSAMKSKSVFLVARGQELTWREWQIGEVYVDVKPIVYAHSVGKCGQCPVIPGFKFRCLDLDGKIIGCFGWLEEGNNQYAKVLNKVLSSDFCEIVDNYIFSENCSRESHSIKLRIGEALKNRIFAKGLVDAIAVLKEHIDFNALVLVYHDENDLLLETFKYFIYSDSLGYFDPFHYYDKEMNNWVRDNADRILKGVGPDLVERFAVNHYQEDFLISGIKNAVQIGKLIVSSTTSGFDIHEKEILQIFVSFIQQRVLDFNKEWRNLSQYFSISQRLRLLENENYMQSWLQPQIKDVAMLYADLSSFTLFSEQVLKDPCLITQMFDIWASGVMARIWQNGGCCDKFVGDCCIAHFGPPFYEEDTKEYCRRAIECAKDIRRWTKEFLQRDEECFKVIRDSDQLEKFGVATGINLGKVNVGIIGPNQDFTAFGAEMNNASRIQAKAGCDEILMMKSVHSQVSDLFDFEGPFTTELKNVKNKVEYYRLKD